jgi:hypothetical protein
MANFNYARMVRKANQLIQKFGQPTPALLRREGIADRPCVAVMIDYTPREIGLRSVGARRFLISTIDPLTHQTLELPPDHEQDLIVFAGAVYRLPTPDSGPRPGGTVLYHDMEGVYDTREV